MIAVTGANGLLGSFIVRRLLDEKRTFVALRRSNSDMSLVNDIANEIEWRNADVLDSVFLEEAFKDVDVVIHTAAIVSFNPRDAERIHQVNVTGTRHVVNACLSNRVKKIIHISSVAALGRLKTDQLIDEQHKWIDSPLNSSYAKSKYLAELEVFRGHEEGIETVVLNPSVILAPADWTKSSARLFKYVWDQKKFFIENDLNYVDVRDVTEAVYQFIDRSTPGHRYILNAGTTSLQTFFQEIAARFGKKQPSIKIGGAMLKVLANAEAVRSWVMRSEPMITTETARLANTHFFYSNEKIKKQLNFRFQSIDQTLDWCCKYYVEQMSTLKNEAK